MWYEELNDSELNRVGGIASARVGGKSYKW